jgi:hypothetical protein
MHGNTVYVSPEKLKVMQQEMLLFSIQYEPWKETPWRHETPPCNDDDDDDGSIFYFRESHGI